MSIKLSKIFVFACACALAAAACSTKPSGNTAGADASRPAASKPPGPLPENGFRAQITLPDAPANLRAGQKETVRVQLKNASDVFWWARGGEVNDSSNNQFYIAAGNRWLKPDGSLVTEMDGRNGIPKDIKPGEETEVPLLITAPQEPGEYLLEVDLVQEQVAWFGDKGSATARTKITVTR